MGHGTKQRDLPIFVSLKKTKQGETPEFTFKDNDVETKGDWLCGYIIDIVVSDYEWPKESGKRIPTYIIHLVDKGQKYKFETSWTGMSRAILNCLMTVEFPGLVNIQVAPSKESGGYPSVFVSVDEDTALSWKWKYEKLSELIDGEEEDKDYTRLNNFWGTQIEETLSPHFKEAFARMSHQGNFASNSGPAAPEPAPTAEATPDGSPKPEAGEAGHTFKAKDIDVSDQLPKPEDAPPPPPASDEPPAVEEESDDLPF